MKNLIKLTLVVALVLEAVPCSQKFGPYQSRRDHYLYAGIPEMMTNMGVQQDLRDNLEMIQVEVTPSTMISEK